MTSLRAAEQDAYDAFWALDEEQKDSPGERYADLFASLAPPPATVLDAGCGSGRGMVALAARGYGVMGCDLSAVGLLEAAQGVPFQQVCLWDDLTALPYLAKAAGLATDGARFDWIYCCDVLEHIPPELTLLVVARLLAIVGQGLFLSICQRPDNFGVLVGRPLHQTVKDFVWWRQRLSEVGTVIEARDLLGDAIYVVKPR